MAQEDRNRVVEWIELLRAQVPNVRQRLRAWWDAVCEEPRLIWETAAVRYGVYLVGGLLALWAVTAVPRLFGPPVPKSARPAATTADFHVVCAEASCGHHFVVHRKFGFSRFPVDCPRCGKRSGERAGRCFSPTCRGQWIAPQSSPEGLRCPVCHGPLE